MKYKIQIPKPCHEDWSKMTPTEKGKFCANCKKEVIDFTNYSNYEIVRKLDRGESVCGRFKDSQLNNELNSLENKSYSKYGIAASLAVLLSVSIPTYSQGNVSKIEIVDSISKPQKHIYDSIEKTKNEAVTISGIVSDNSGPISGVKVVVKDSERYTETDFYGNFSIEIERKEFDKNVFLEFNSLKFSQKVLKVNEYIELIKINLETERCKVTSNEIQVSTGLVVVKKNK